MSLAHEQLSLSSSHDSVEIPAYLAGRQAEAKIILQRTHERQAILKKMGYYSTKRLVIKNRIKLIDKPELPAEN